MSIHDLGLARVPSTVAIDGSVASPSRGWPSRDVCRGLEYAVVRPVPRRRDGRSRPTRRVLVSLGGGPRLGLAMRLACELRRRHPDVEVLVPSPTAVAAGVPRSEGIRRVVAADGLGRLLRQVDLAILGGGVSLYEAAAAGVPVVAVTVVPAQRPTIAGFVRAGVVRSAGAMSDGRRMARLRRIVDIASAGLVDEGWRRRAASLGPRLVDGHGARRVARAIERLLDRTRRD